MRIPHNGFVPILHIHAAGDTQVLLHKRAGQYDAYF